MKIFPVCVLALAISTFASWSEAGGVRCRGLFLLNGKFANADVLGCQVFDSLRTDVLLVDVALQRYRPNISLENSWKLESDALFQNAHLGVQGNFRNLHLGANLSGSRDFRHFDIVSEIHAADSLFFLGVTLGRLSVGEFRAKWTSGDRNSVLDTVNLVYRGNFLGRGAFLGSRLRKHSFRVSGNFWDSRREPFQDDTYAIRDSSKLFRLRSGYAYRSDLGTFSADIFWTSLDARLFGIRTKDGKSKRFAFLPAKANVEGLDVSWESSFFELRAGGILLQGSFPHSKARFYETLAPNRMLNYSLLQAFSFAYFKRDYRLFGEADGFLSYFKAKRDFTFYLGRFLVQPGISANFLYAQGNLDASLESVTTSLFVRKTQTTDYTANIKAAGVIVNPSLALKTPRQKFFLAAACYQLVPFLVARNFEKIPENGQRQDVGLGNSSKGKSEASIFRSGFAFDLSIGFHF